MQALKAVRPLIKSSFNAISSSRTKNFYACTQSTVLGEKIAKAYGMEVWARYISRDTVMGSFNLLSKNPFEGRRIFIIGSTNPRPENLMEMLLMLDAAKRASARHITAVMPYFGWARQDRKDKPRVPIAAKLIAKMLKRRGRHESSPWIFMPIRSKGFLKNQWTTCLPRPLFCPIYKA